ncbi:MAG: phosphoribosyltransferase family protein [Bacteroidales bacterium]
MNKITLKDKTFVKYISQDEIDKAIERVAQEINEEYKNDTPILIITLNGAIVFAVDLLKHLNILCKISCIKLSSYQGVSSTNSVKDLIGLSENLENQRVIIIEDIIDTGCTYEHIVEMLEKEKVKDIKIATMTYKPDAYTKTLPIHYIGLSIPNKFVVGRGLDYDGLGRNLTDIYQVCD